MQNNNVHYCLVFPKQASNNNLHMNLTKIAVKATYLHYQNDNKCCIVAQVFHVDCWCWVLNSNNSFGCAQYSIQVCLICLNDSVSLFWRKKKSLFSRISTLIIIYDVQKLEKCFLYLILFFPRAVACWKLWHEFFSLLLTRQKKK